ncbi:MAG: hypothetical protein V3T55_05355, partial [Anaerolineales bacterium]
LSSFLITNRLSYQRDGKKDNPRQESGGRGDRYAQCIDHESLRDERNEKIPFENPILAQIS